MELSIEKYICNTCGVEVVCRDYAVVLRREKRCIECSGEVEQSDATLKRIAIKNGTYVKPVKVTKHNHKTPKQPISLRREDKPMPKADRARNKAKAEKKHRLNVLRNSYKEAYRQQFEEY